MRLLVVGVLLTAGAVVAAQTPAAKTWNFDADAPNALPAGFTNETGKWRVMADSTARSQKHAVMQMAESGGSAFNIALVTDSSYADVDLSVRFKSVSGKIDQGGGVVWRARDAKNYYIARYNPLEENFRVYRVIDGRRGQLDTAEIPRREGWLTLRVVMRGDAIICYLDGKQYLKASDTSLPGAGKIGLWTKADAQTMFDDLTVKAP